MIKKILILSLALVLGFWTTISLADVNVNGYMKKNGTYVAPHHRSSPDGNQRNNWSSKGNVNPYTGKKGYNNPKNSFGY